MLQQTTLQKHIQNATAAIDRLPEDAPYQQAYVFGVLRGMLEGIAGKWEHTAACVDPETAASIQELLKTIETKLQ